MLGGSVDENGNLKDAEDIVWYHNVDDAAGVKHNPIYNFYEEWDVNNEGNLGNPGDKHYRCYHSNRKIFTPMHDLFLVMKTRGTPTDDEILMASGKKDFNDLHHTEYFKVIEAQAAAASKGHETFEKLLIEWMVVCDQPFDEVDPYQNLHF
ncbi:hypothetical protein BYT27DRAFT_7228363 [Phlegmacium glaucopus]|nr:hypothetical protein BYT27DRAFT_7228363 [Phlegmacium glaucopus]